MLQIDLLGSGTVTFDSDAFLNHLQSWLNRLVDESDGATSYIVHWFEKLLQIISPEISISVTGTGTENNPWRISIDDMFTSISLPTGLSVEVIAFLTTHPDSQRTISFGLRAIYEIEENDSRPNFGGGVTAWLADLSFGGGSGFSFSFNPRISATCDVYGIWDSTLSEYSSLYSPAYPITINTVDLYIKVDRARVGIEYSHISGLLPVLELHDVTFDTVNQLTWPVLDLLSSDTPAEVLDAAADAIEDIVRSMFADQGPLQILGSLVGIVPPRGSSGTSFYDAWETAGLCVDLMSLITDPISTIKSYYRSLSITSFNPGGSLTSVKALACVYDGLVYLIQSILDSNLSHIHI